MKRCNTDQVYIVVVIIVTLGVYYWAGLTKSFEFGGVEWVYEEDVNYYHGRFMNLIGYDYVYNIYLRNDPRENDVGVEGTLDKDWAMAIGADPESMVIGYGDSGEQHINLANSVIKASDCGLLIVDSLAALAPQ